MGGLSKYTSTKKIFKSKYLILTIHLMKRISLIFLIISPSLLSAQTISLDRVSKLKSSVVRVLVDDQAKGTAFFVTEDGWLATCWHVVEPAIMVDTIKKVVNIKKITIEFFNGEKVEVGIMIELLNNGYINAKSFDYCLLKIQTKPKTVFSFLKLGTFNNINEGEQVYTCGYPLGTQQQIISVGILSTKWVDTIKLTRTNYPDSLFFRNVAWLDLTMNRGNSSGPMIKLGNSITDDEVIGISTFILNPFAKAADELLEFLSKIPPNSGAFLNGVNFNALSKLFGSAIANNSVGVSGCVSIDHLTNKLKK